ncbi:hypothetical protein [Myxococcus llanfairpwllgwyngyllgogerychwyrndrobwllllantysiliogogogochensis]|nr:hypothetical protein [Myxococcus llanfairpwllgwyngyllgogerychwyrndrobwllllantysiliogogogochensis]
MRALLRAPRGRLSLPLRMTTQPQLPEGIGEDIHRVVLALLRGAGAPCG